jgi:hypothetical protein
MYWNVRVSIDKCMASMQDVHEEFDVYAFGETHFTEARQRTYRFAKHGYVGYHATRADGNGGVAVYVRSTLEMQVVRTRTDPEAVFVSVGQQDTLLVVLYAKPARPGERDNVFDTIAHELASIPDHRCTAIIGDLNARVAGRNREVLHSVEQDPREQLAGTARGDELPVRRRRSADANMNTRGRQCLDFCNVLMLDIANGCAPGINNEAFTFHSMGDRGRSTVDLLLISAQQFHRIVRFDVSGEPPDRCTDHARLELEIETVLQPGVQVNVRKPRMRWVQEHWERYAQAVRARMLQLQGIADRLPTGTGSLPVEANEVHASMMRTLTEVANVTFGDDRPANTGIEGVGLNDWFDDECRHARACVLQERERCVELGLPGHRSPRLRCLTSRYHSTLKDKKLKAQARAAASLVGLAKKDPSAFWKWLHGSLPHACPVSCQDMHHHFRTLLEATDAHMPKHTSWHTHEDVRAGRDNGVHVRGAGEGVGTAWGQGAAALSIPITQTEVIVALKVLGNNKASHDGHRAELMKYAKTYDVDSKTYVYDLVPYCTHILDMVFSTGSQLLKCMQGATLVPIYKGRGARDAPANYRGVAVSSALYKLYASILNRRLDMYLEGNGMRAYTQCGFRKGHSTHTAMFALEHAIHQRCAARTGHTPQALYVCFVDFNKAFDSINRDKLWQRLHQLGVGGSMMRALQVIYEYTPMTVKVNGKRHHQPIVTSKGVKQGCPLSPLLFGTIIEQLHDKITAQCSHTACVQVQNQPLADLIFADDVAMIAGDLEGSSAQCEALDQFSEEHDLRVNVPKSMYVIFQPMRTRATWPSGLQYRGQELQEVQTFKYLGLPVSGTRWTKDCLQYTTTLARRAMWALIRKMGQSDTVPLQTKVMLFDTAVGSVASYGCSVWGVQYLEWRSEHHIFTRNRFQMLVLQYLRTISGAHAHTSRWVLLREFNMDPVQVEWAVRCAKWWNKVHASDTGGIAKATLLENIQLFREGCKVCWTMLFLKCMVSLGLVGGHTIDSLRQLEVQDISTLVFSDTNIREAYRGKYEQLYWDTHCTEPRNRGGRHTAFIKHNCWFHSDKNPVLTLNAWDRQVQTLLKFRVGTHKLRCNEHSTVVSNRTCRLCDSRVVEDEYHTVLECEAYRSIRDRRHFCHLFSRGETGGGWDDLKAFMNQEDQYSLSRCINAILWHRSRVVGQLDMQTDLVNPALDAD